MKEETNNKPKLIKRVPNIPKKPQKGSKFNIFWVYAAIILGLILLQFLFNTDNSKPIPYRDFETKMLLTGDVQKLVAYKYEDLVRKLISPAKKYHQAAAPVPMGYRFRA